MPCFKFTDSIKILTAVSMTPCWLVRGYRRFGVTCYL